MTPDDCPEQTHVVAGLSVDSHRATLDQLSQIAAPSNRAIDRELADLPGVTEAFAIQTCNRVEAYAVAPTQSIGHDAVTEVLAELPLETARHLGHEAAIRHLMAVSAGLESVIVGEDAILGQVSTAYQEAVNAGTIGPLLEPIVESAIRVGKRVRTETSINDGSLSLARAAVRLAGGPVAIDHARVLVIGAGEMATRVVRCLGDAPMHLAVANRSAETAADLAATVECHTSTLKLSALGDRIEGFDVAFSATGGESTVVDKADLADAQINIVDLARPRDLPAEAATLPGVTYHDLDDLNRTIGEEWSNRRDAADRAAMIVDEAQEQLLTRLKRQRADRVIAAMYETADRIKERELETAVRHLGPDLDPEDREALESFADAMVNSLLATPTQCLRTAAENEDWQTITAAFQLFRGYLDDGEPSAEQPIPGNVPEYGRG